MEEEEELTLGSSDISSENENSFGLPDDSIMQTDDSISIIETSEYTSESGEKSKANDSSAGGSQTSMCPVEEEEDKAMLKTPSGVQYRSVREATQALVKEEGETLLLEALKGFMLAGVGPTWASLVGPEWPHELRLLST